MSIEGQIADKKSLRMIEGKSADFEELAKDCVGLANAQGGRLLIGIEDNSQLPPAGQRIEMELSDKVRKRIGELTVNVVAVPELRTARNGAEYIELNVPRSLGVASTTDGRYFIRVGDATVPVTGDDVMRLANERAILPWETLINLNIISKDVDHNKWQAFRTAINASDRVSSFIKSRTDDELLDHYFLTRDGLLTNLGILWVGRREDRALLGTAPVLQFIKYDDSGNKVAKRIWDDYSMNPLELIDAVWQEIPDWREGYEIPDGLFRRTIPHYDEVVIRELMANALVHRPYTQRGDIFINLYPDRLQVVNPGRLPLGVTPQNILHASMSRNPNLARVFYDLKLMEREGSGYDRMYEVQLVQGKEPPEVVEGADSVIVTVRKRIIKSEVIAFIAKADEIYQLSQREKICLGLLVQHETLNAIQIERFLELKDASQMRHWCGRLVEWEVVRTKGRTKGTTYFIDPNLLRTLEFKGTTTLKGIEKHRLRELLIRDLEIYGEASISEIHPRVGSEIPRRTIQAQLKQLVDEGVFRRAGKHPRIRYVYAK